MTEERRKHLIMLWTTLVAARDLADVGHAKGAHARDASGKPVGSHDPSAASFCMIGAILGSVPLNIPCNDCTDTIAFMKTVMAGRGVPDGVSMAVWSDAPERTKEEIVAMFEAGIAIVNQELEA